MYLLVCSYSLDWKTEKCLEMGWNCQNTLGSSVSYRILRESKCFTLSRFEKWVSWYLLVCSYSLDWKTEKCPVKVVYLIAYFENRNVLLFQDLKWVRCNRLVRILWLENRKKILSIYVRKYCFLSHTSRIEMFYSFKIWEVGFVGTGLFVFSAFENRKMSPKWVEIVKIR